MTTRARLALVAFYVALIAGLALLLYGVLIERHAAQRGVWFPGEPLPPPTDGATPLGATVELTQYRTAAALDAALAEAEAMGLGWLRQELPWDSIEPSEGQFQWAPWDRVIRAAHARGFRLVLVLNRTPAWARQPDEAHNPLPPPPTPPPSCALPTLPLLAMGSRCGAGRCGTSRT